MEAIEPVDSPFASSAKRLVRIFDGKIIDDFRKRNFPNKPLRYLGLPGPDLLDVNAWREYIGAWTAVQIGITPDDKEAADELELNVMRSNLEREFTFKIGDIDNMIADSADELDWPFQIINLDYIGGLVNARNDGSSKRIETIRSVFEYQQGEKFILLATLNLRDRDRSELTKYISAIEQELVDLEFLNVKERIAAHKTDFGNAGLLKLYLPPFLGDNVKYHRLHVHAPILYQGSKQMIHFAIECEPFTSTAGGSMLSIAEKVSYINLPILTSDNAEDLKSNDIGAKISTSLGYED